MKFRFSLITFLLLVWKISDLKWFLKSEFTMTTENFNALKKVFLELYYPNRPIFILWIYEISIFLNNFLFSVWKMSDFKCFLKSEFTMILANFDALTKVFLKLYYPNRPIFILWINEISIFLNNFLFICLKDVRF